MIAIRPEEACFFERDFDVGGKKVEMEGGGPFNLRCGKEGIDSAKMVEFVMEDGLEFEWKGEELNLRQDRQNSTKLVDFSTLFGHVNGKLGKAEKKEGEGFGTLGRRSKSTKVEEVGLSPNYRGNNVVSPRNSLKHSGQSVKGNNTVSPRNSVKQLCMMGKTVNGSWLSRRLTKALSSGRELQPLPSGREVPTPDRVCEKPSGDSIYALTAELKHTGTGTNGTSKSSKLDFSIRDMFSSEDVLELNIPDNAQMDDMVEIINFSPRNCSASDRLPRLNTSGHLQMMPLSSRASQSEQIPSRQTDSNQHPQPRNENFCKQHSMPEETKSPTSPTYIQFSPTQADGFEFAQLQRCLSFDDNDLVDDNIISPRVASEARHTKRRPRSQRKKRNVVFSLRFRQCYCAKDGSKTCAECASMDPECRSPDNTSVIIHSPPKVFDNLSESPRPTGHGSCKNEIQRHNGDIELMPIIPED